MTTKSSHMRNQASDLSSHNILCGEGGQRGFSVHARGGMDEQGTMCEGKVGDVDKYK